MHTHTHTHTLSHVCLCVGECVCICDQIDFKESENYSKKIYVDELTLVFSSISGMGTLT